MTTWKNDTYRLRLLDGDKGAVLVLRERGTERATFCRSYEWHQRGQAALDAEALAQLGHMEEVEVTDLEGMFA